MCHVSCKSFSLKHVVEDTRPVELALSLTQDWCVVASLIVPICYSKRFLSFVHGLHFCALCE